MNPLTLVKRIQKINSKEAALGISEDASWHAKYRDSAYVFVGGIPYDLTEGDLLAVFAQYGEIVDVNLVRDKGTGKSKGFAFVAYEDQRSTNLAVDNLNGAQVLGRIIRVDHVNKYKKKEEEDEETERQKREERGVCRAFQRGECTRGAGCKFSHDEQRAANTGWGPEDHRSSRSGHDKFQDKVKHEMFQDTVKHEKFQDTVKHEKRSGQPTRVLEATAQEGLKSGERDARNSRAQGTVDTTESHRKRSELNSRDQDSRGLEKRSERKEREANHNEEWERRGTDRRSTRHEVERNAREDYDRMDDKRSRRDESEFYQREDRGDREGDKRSTRYRDSSSHHRSARDEDQRHRSQSHR